jgi:hypothetical protein
MSDRSGNYQARKGPEVKYKYLQVRREGPAVYIGAGTIFELSFYWKDFHGQSKENGGKNSRYNFSTKVIRDRSYLETEEIYQVENEFFSGLPYL